MEYRIVKTNGHYGIYQILKNNGVFERSAHPELKAESLQELRKKIDAMNPAFWKPIFIEEKNKA